MSLLGKLYKMFTGRSEATEGQIKAAIGELEKAHGSGRKAAAAVGIPETTWRGWRSGKVKKIKPESAAKLKAAQRSNRFATGVRRPRRIMTGNLTLRKATVIVSDDETTREKINIGPYLSDSTRGKVADGLREAARDADPDAIVSAFDDAMEEYVPGMTLVSLEDIDF